VPNASNKLGFGALDRALPLDRRWPRPAGPFFWRPTLGRTNLRNPKKPATEKKKRTTLSETWRKKIDEQISFLKKCTKVTYFFSLRSKSIFSKELKLITLKFKFSQDHFGTHPTSFSTH
jgi:hypothetical protein